MIQKQIDSKNRDWATEAGEYRKYNCYIEIIIVRSLNKFMLFRNFLSWKKGCVFFSRIGTKPAMSTRLNDITYELITFLPVIQLKVMLMIVLL